ncbi:hypothetical protein Catovirus_2_136 [Catovirus CTV1]|uniref:Uncharacterized protein n=1 Tax=Catovirus CTV1 TaxID=1977631 RepID=A0A1V0SBT9_9VIRU|nr:hypothetical protein Catovirus_2_136 [Catovirus CTV1]
MEQQDHNNIKISFDKIKMVNIDNGRKFVDKNLLKSYETNKNMFKTKPIILRPVTEADKYLNNLLIETFNKN